MEIPALGPVAVCCAGTSDVPVCEEAVVTLEVMGVEALRVYDVGVAGIHRLLARREELARARAVVVAAGMEGALPSVVGGLVGRPVIAVPTSVGYGASLGGLARAARHAQLLRPQRHGGQHRQRLRRRLRGRADRPRLTWSVPRHAQRLLVLEPIGGLAGDMFLAAALDLGVDRGGARGAARHARRCRAGGSR